MRLMISEVLERCGQLPTRQEKINWLRTHGSAPVQLILQYAFHPDVKFLLPSGKPPYKTVDLHESSGMLYANARKMYLFVEGGNPNLKQTRREHLFIELLESIDPKDAELLCHVKEKKLPYKGVTYKLVQEAFPGLLP